MSRRKESGGRRARPSLDGANERATVRGVKCFVIGPIGDRDADYGSPDRTRYEEALEVFEKVIAPACDALGLEPVRSDLISTAGEITEQVCRHLRDDDIVIADVTDANPNVMYELGLRHTRDLLTAPIGEKGRLPFDISVIRTIPFKRTPYGLVEAREGLRKMLEDGLAGKWNRVTATRLWAEVGPGASDVSVSEGDGENEEPRGFLERLADSEAAMPLVSEHLQSITTLIEKMGASATKHAPEVQNAPTAGAKLIAANRFADELEPIAEELETEAGLYADAVKTVDEGLSYLFDRIQAAEYQPSEIQSAREMLEAVVRMGTAAEQGGLNELATGVSSLSGATRRLKQPIERIRRAVRRFDEGTSRVRAWAKRAAELLSTLPPQSTGDGEHV
jgi:hypothetical protein